MKKQNIALILAGGSGSRFVAELPKQYLEINGKKIIGYTINAFQTNNNIQDVFVVCSVEYADMIRRLYEVKTIIGGDNRQSSVYLGLREVYFQYPDSNVLIHDAARPLVTHEIIDENIMLLDSHEAATTAIKSTDSILIAENNILDCITERNKTYRIQTPQSFVTKKILTAHEAAKEGFTDDAGLYKSHYKDAKIAIAMGSHRNLKITYPEDLLLLKSLLMHEN